jgi:hypothetical protein
MSSLKVYAVLAGCSLAVAGLSGCFITTDTSPGPGPGPNPAVPTGSLTVTWTVAGSHSPPSCAQFGAYDLELVILDRFRRPITKTSAPCTDFSLTVDLPPSDYTAEVTLVDSQSREVSTSLPLQDIQITPRSGLTIDVDFPSSSRL